MLSFLTPYYLHIALGLFAFGNITGASAVWWVWDVTSTYKKVATLKEDNQNFRKAAGIATDIDIESDKSRVENAKIVTKILEGLSKPPPAEETETHHVVPAQEPVKINVPVFVPVPGKVKVVYRTRFVCIDPDSMRQLRLLK